ncbi:MAG TPA: nucleoside triphosphate pyrophosphatase [Candidatus Omnitrophota bacterium]|nr:nucleoside triphosphate pyrophosphatase [Candidatus Omnitrophota bacterium]
MRKIVLASASVRRSRILSECGIAHTVEVSGYPEDHFSGEKVWDIVAHHALKKAEAVALKNPDAVVIGADTLVFHDDAVIGKPAGYEEARELLKRFSGNTIEVYTGLCVIDGITGKISCGIEKSDVLVKKISEEEIERYFKLLGPHDKAGGFSIEGAGSVIFDDIRGSYFNILGLPMRRLAELFRDLGLEISDHMSGQPEK